MLRVAMNGEVVNRRLRTFQSVIVEPVPAKEQKSWELVELPGSDHSLALGAWLPPGKYRLTYLKGESHSKFFPASAAMMLPAFLDTFEVQAGRLTDLDTIVYLNLGGGSSTIVPFDSHLRGRTVLAKYQPEIAEVLNEGEQPARVNFKQWSPETNSVDTWGGSGGAIGNAMDRSFSKHHQAAPVKRMLEAKSEAELRDLMMHSPAKLNGSALADDGTEYFGSTLGRIARRDATGRWTTWFTGAAEEITAVALADGALFAADEYGGVLRSGDDGKTFAEVGRAPNGRAIVDMYRLPNREWMVVTQQIVWEYLNYIDTRTFYVVADLAQLATATTSLQLRSEVSKYIYGGVAPFPVSAGPAGNGYAAFEPPKTLHRYDMNARTWSASALPGKKSGRVSFSRDGSLIFSENAGIRSLDGGKTWARMEKYYMPSYRIAFYDSMRGIQIQHIPNSWDSAKMFATQDGGVSWTKTSEPPAFFCPTFGVNEKLERAFCITEDATVLATTRGEIWTPETP
jgi:photosystem II stability/assembly factor-like uncharacterized protein